MAQRTFQRRTILGGTLAAAASILALPLQRARAADSIALPQSMSLFTDTGPNVLVFGEGDSLVVVDSGAEAGGAMLMDYLKGLAPAGVPLLFNTHWHDEQTAGNEAFGNAGTRIIAHEKTRLRLATRYYLPQEQRYKLPAPAAACPKETFYTSGSLTAGGETVDYGYLLQAHTDGDIYVHFRTANVLAVGDVVSPQRDPGFDWYGGGWLGGRVDAMDLLLELANEDTLIVPAYGPVIGRAQLQAERDLMAFLYEALVDQIRMGFSPQDSLDAGVMNGLARRWNDPYSFLYDAYKGLWGHHNTLAPELN